MARASDRWITPGVIISAIISASVVVLGIGAGLVWLAYKGIDSDPVLKLVAQVVTAIGSLGTLLLQLANRQTAAKTERNTGLLADVVDDALQNRGRHSAPEHGATPADGRETAA